MGEELVAILTKLRGSSYQRHFLERDHVRGILLKETRSGALVKIGFFTTRGLFEQEGAMTRIFPVRSVDWRVL